MEYLIVFLPFLGVLFSSLFINFRQSLFLQLLTTSLVSMSAICSFILFFTLKSSYTIEILPWITVGNLKSYFSIHVDSLTALMFLVVTTVSAVVHCYSIGYMENDEHKSRFFCYLSLFTFAMLILVSSADFLQLFLGWEGVGLCSYLLIGFWFKKESANLASMKAFIVNRVGDFSFLIGIFAIYHIFGSIKFIEVLPNVTNYLNTEILGINAITFICMALFIGCMGKSAQIGLHTWLPDAMEGPTPVSALIHAATMVTAGVFLVVKTSILFEYSPFTKGFILTIGAITAIFAASVALFQSDIKKIIAYSTCSQLGYMFVACGLGAYNVAIFHLATHAFFKALLFLCAGNIIHALHEEQNIYKMGNLYKKIPVTCAMMMIGSLALCGIFPFAGFYSKDLIIEASSVSNAAFTITVITALLTSLYSFKIIFNVFYGKQNFQERKFHKISKVMVYPLLILVIPSIVAGYFGVNFLQILNESFWMNTGIQFQKIIELHGIKHFAAITFALFGILLSYILFKLKKHFITHLVVIAFSILAMQLSIYLGCAIISGYLVQLLLPRLTSLVLINKYYFDDIYNFLFIKNLKRLSSVFWKVIDIKIIDFIPNSLFYIVKFCSESSVKLQTGYIYHYALLMILGIIFIIFAM